MPDKPTWLLNLPEAIKHLEAMPLPWVDRLTIEQLLGIGRRRAQQIMKPLVVHTLGTNGLVDRADLISHLRKIAEGEQAFYETRRREHFAQVYQRLVREETTQPKLMVETPIPIFSSRIANLPAGVELAPGQIVLRGFKNPEEAVQLMIALAMAIGNDPDDFAKVISAEK